MKIIKLIFPVLFCIMLSSCGMISSVMEESEEYDPADIFANDYPFAEETALKVVDCLNESDVEGLKALLSDSVLTQEDVDAQIDELFDFYKGKSVSHNEVRRNEASTESRDGRYVFKILEIDVHQILTDENETYNLEFYYGVVDDKNNSNIGILKLWFRDEEGHIILRLFDEPGKYQ